MFISEYELKTYCETFQQIEMREPSYYQYSPISIGNDRP